MESINLASPIWFSKHCLQHPIILLSDFDFWWWGFRQHVESLRSYGMVVTFFKPASLCASLTNYTMSVCLDTVFKLEVVDRRLLILVATNDKDFKNTMRYLRYHGYKVHTSTTIYILLTNKQNSSCTTDALWLHQSK